MPTLIDGYNLLYVTGIVGHGRGPGGLERSRTALLNFLAASLDPAEIARTTIVFDARNAPPGLPRTMSHHGIVVRFAAECETADEMIAELIRVDSAPRRLTVVSSDHEVQRSARRRRAKAVDSDIWYAELIRARRQRLSAASDLPARPAVPLLEEDVRYWLRFFGEEPPLKLEESSEADSSDETYNPFPPGYGCELEEP